MSDLERADRELAALGAVPASLAELVKRYGEADRSLARADAVLAELGDGELSPAAPLEPRPSFLPLGWVDQTANGSEAPLPSIEAREEITVTSGLPAMDSEPPPSVEAEPAQALEPLAAEPAVQASEPVASEAPPQEPIAATAPEAPASAATAGEDEDEPRLSMPLPDSLAPVQAAAIDPASMRPGTLSAETYAPRSSRPPRPDLQRLLDEELDPREFPSSRPPPPNAGAPAPTPIPSLPPVPRVSQASSDPAPDSDFELLVDDDDIIEIDEEGN